VERARILPSETLPGDETVTDPADEFAAEASVIMVLPEFVRMPAEPIETTWT
jgi:hypothetical protein